MLRVFKCLNSHLTIELGRRTATVRNEHGRITNLSRDAARKLIADTLNKPCPTCAAGRLRRPEIPKDDTGIVVSCDCCHFKRSYPSLAEEQRRAAVR